MVSKTLTAESTNEQTTSGLTNCSPAEFARIQQLNADYNARFGWPFILAVRGPRGIGPDAPRSSPPARRLENHPTAELAECLRNIHRIAEMRLADESSAPEPVLGNRCGTAPSSWRAPQRPGHAEQGHLTVTYLTQAHQACQVQLQRWMRDCGFDEVRVDAVGNVVGVYHGRDP